VSQPGRKLPFGCLSFRADPSGVAAFHAYQLVCGSDWCDGLLSKALVIKELSGSWLDWLSGTEDSEGLLFGLAQARGVSKFVCGL